MRILDDNFPDSLSPFRSAIHRCLTAFESVLPIQRVILFGSYVRNQQDASSDVDLCLLIPGIESQYRTACLLRKAIGTIRDKPPMSLIPITPERLDQKIVIDDPFYATVLEEGICIAEED